MEERKYVNVSTIKGLYDEVSEPVTMDISDRELCLSHRFINASLHWHEFSGGVPLEAEDKPQFHRIWGKAYGGICYCKRCKLIKCIHNFTDAYFEVKHDSFRSKRFTIGHCVLCNRRVLRETSGYFTPSQEALALLVRIAKDMGIHFSGDPLSDGFGSGYYLELPYTVSKMLVDNPNQAENFVRGIFIRGRIDNNTMALK